MDGNLQVEGDFLTMLKIFSNLTSQKKQKEEVSYHYDLGNDFYSLWLGITSYRSC